MFTVFRTQDKLTEHNSIINKHHYQVETNNFILLSDVPQIPCKLKAKLDFVTSYLNRVPHLTVATSVFKLE